MQTSSQRWPATATHFVEVEEEVEFTYIAKEGI